ncbi:Sugar phosphate isomerase/epimerase [Roseateles sp. YR242]|uniref:sugar phosphate isomerase/epimerase family protein n=1 Tax=Roseateles sp. YR242 TaxID=1855305 RepID=UPI0008BE241F|nr:TIM barrel protein [Roseateles sp. YR242]SEL67548.1 Sugar phosphate isomerase/epimerase [Roseateles sp. YR242]
MRVLSLAALTVLELSPVDMVLCAAQAGYAAVGLRPVAGTPQEPQWSLLGDTPQRRDVRAALADTGVSVLDVELLRLHPQTDVATAEPLLETGAALGAAFVIVAGHDPERQRLADKLGQLARLARSYGLRPCLEPMPWTAVRDFSQALALAQASGSDDVGVLVDPLHFDRGGNHSEQLLSVPAQRLPYFQFCDAPHERPATTEALIRQAREARLPPGDGELDLLGILSAGPPGVPLSLEVPMAGGAGTALARATQVRQAAAQWLLRHGLAV